MELLYKAILVKRGFPAYSFKRSIDEKGYSYTPNNPCALVKDLKSLSEKMYPKLDKFQRKKPYLA